MKTRSDASVRTASISLSRHQEDYLGDTGGSTVPYLPIPQVLVSKQNDCTKAHLALFESALKRIPYCIILSNVQIYSIHFLKLSGGLGSYHLVQVSDI
jgi:hypothetical protein